MTKLRWVQVGPDYILRGIRPRLSVQPDQTYPGMWRISFRGWISDMVNLSRAKDAARELGEEIVARRACSLLARRAHHARSAEHVRRYAARKAKDGNRQPEATSPRANPSVAVCGLAVENTH